MVNQNRPPAKTTMCALGNPHRINPRFHHAASILNSNYLDCPRDVHYPWGSLQQDLKTQLTVLHFVLGNFNHGIKHGKLEDPPLMTFPAIHLHWLWGLPSWPFLITGKLFILISHLWQQTCPANPVFTGDILTLVGSTLWDSKIAKRFITTRTRVHGGYACISKKTINNNTNGMATL